MPVDTLHAILEQQPKTIYEIRDAAICELFYSSGLRLGELVNLNSADIDLDTQEVHVINGKGGKHRIVPLGEPARDALILWNKTRSDIFNIDKQALFISRHGTCLCVRQVQNRVKTYGNKIGFQY